MQLPIKHESWGANIAEHLSELRIHYNDDVDDLQQKVGHSLHQYGFALLSGLGAGESKAAVAEKLLVLSKTLGWILPQSSRNEQVEDIRDFSDIDDKDERGYRSAGELTPHSDPPTLIVLHCLQPAKSGGESYLVNVRRIHDAISRVSPELLDVLYQGFHHVKIDGKTGEFSADTKPRPTFMHRDAKVSCVHYRPFAEKAAELRGKSLSKQQIAALDLFDECANRKDHALRFTLQPGETMILHNRTVLHARTDYEDWPEADKRRHLLRVWIDAPELLPVSVEHELGDIFAR
jgi:alpha-ketoglutarate-dependent taurine dioxygenase